ncbi:MAG TPA: isoprenylcysteine carboxylmethyltransferase family protein [Terracidiphilus sp.]|jgi:protein-S-isoprenylcysteine O-methyltransferase Ste14|nr:isoprenylcysteine carboxylmethyltransferase family protein [Terracidiphilus sp.]
MTVSGLFTTLYWTWVGSEALLQIVTPTSRSTGQVKDRGSLLVLLAVIFGSIWMAMWYGATHPHNLPGNREALKVTALGLLIAGLLVRWTAIFTLGVSFSTNVAIHANQKLRRTGLFRWVRHPSYSGMLLIFAGVGLSQRNWVSLAILLVFPTAALLYRIHVEELALGEAFGDDYAQYRQSTFRLIPGIY